MLLMKTLRSIGSFIRLNRGLLMFLVLMTVFRSSVADWNIVPTGSMKPTIVEGDRIHVDKLAYDLQIPLTGRSLNRLAEPERGDIVVFDSEAADLRLVKRLIGLPGDTVAMRDNQLYLNGEAATYEPLMIAEAPKGTTCYLETVGGHSHPVCVSGRRSHFGNFGPVLVDDDAFLMLGDNRDNSADFRVHGFARRDELAGRARNVVMSHDRDNAWLPRRNRLFSPLR